MSENYTAEDFARANLAAAETRAARRVGTGDVEQWITEHTLRDRQEKADRKRQKLVDHIADQDRVIRRRNDEIAALRAEVRDAQAPLSLDGLAATWEAAEVPTEDAPIREGDVLIYPLFAGYCVRPSRGDSPLPEARILSRAPKREPHENLADAIREVWPSAYDEIDIGALAYALHERGVGISKNGRE